MNYFYFHRMGSEDILAEHLIDERYARIALHPKDTAVTPYPGWCSGCEDFDLLGSWADAGDFGIYTVNHAISGKISATEMTFLQSETFLATLV